MVWRYSWERAVGVVAAAMALAIPAEIAMGRLRGWDDALTDAWSGAAWVIAGLIAWSRRSTSPVGPVMIVIGLLLWPMNLRFFDGPPWLTTVGWLFTPFWGAPFLALLLLTFPSLRLRARFDRAVVGAVLLSCTLSTVYLFFHDPRAPECTDCEGGPNLLAVGADEGIARALGSAAELLVGLAAIAGLGRLVYRWRRATPPLRAGIAPVFVAIAIYLVALVALLADLLPAPVYYASLGVVPAGFMVGLLRTRVTRSTVGALLSELARAPEGETLRAAIARALGDPSLQIGFPGPSGYVDHEGAPFVPADARAVTEVPGRSGPAALLVHDPALLEDPGLIDAVAAAAQLALDNARLQAEVRAQLLDVRASRQRIVQAGAEERRRLERDLHDGVQQRLLALALELRVLAEQLPDAEAAERVRRAAGDAEASLLELRELARGILPPVLVQDGLRSALQALAERAALPVRVDAQLPPQRLSPGIEAAAYFICCESLANAVKHGGARHLHLRLDVHDERLHVVAEDDGRGGAVPADNGGLAGLRDRVAALDGEFAIADRDGGGTRVVASLPLRAEAVTL